MNTSISSEERESAATALQQAKSLGPEIGIDVEGILSTPQRVAALEEQMRMVANKMEEIFAYFQVQVKPTVERLQGKNPSVHIQTGPGALPSQTGSFIRGSPSGGITGAIEGILKDPKNVSEIIKAIGGGAADDFTTEIAKELKKGFMAQARQYAANFMKDIGKEDYIKKVAETDKAGKS